MIIKVYSTVGVNLQTVGWKKLGENGHIFLCFECSFRGPLVAGACGLGSLLRPFLIILIPLIDTKKLFAHFDKRYLE